MAHLVRLIGRSSANKFLSYENNVLKLVRPVSIKPVQAQPPCQQTHDERNMKIGRPYSPHLTIYAPQLTSMTSLTHRTTGLILSGFSMVFGLGALLPNDGLVGLIDFVHDQSFLLFLVKFGLAFPFAYHFNNGVRHLLWDTGKFLTIKEVYTTGYVMVALSAVLGAYLAFL